MRRSALPRLVLAAVAAAATATQAVASPNDGLLGTPLDTSLPPPPAASPALPGGSPLVEGGLIAGGEIGTAFGSGGVRGSIVRVDSGLIGGNTRAFVELGTSQGPRWRDQPTVRGDGAAFGVETALPHGLTVEVGAGAEHDRLRLPGIAAEPTGSDRPGP